ncbi:hypothetical protein DBR40_24845 [Pedobacter sp. KBW01]|uniref:hypothetical protein n=1 Tax=Pedobacter sp. KBW01 TaxID=2153364 RepID=UPI000F5937A5|nr:hypothetical protein [Pedobacter sp. KBW01]RQO65102.1 hypothetical protein DBR40_24845 [Pedobacter sp. KBW01]
MAELSLFNVAVQAEQMRNAQKIYFQTITKAKKTKNPGDFAEAKKVLEISKKLEIVFDDTINKILNTK